MRKAYSYIRWSSGKQKNGASLARQTLDPLVTEFIKNHKLNVVETMIDDSVSGFKGKNFSNDKALGKFIEKIRQGRIEKGSVLILENMDRFGRDIITNMIKRFIEIVENGVSIGVVSMDVIIDLEMMNSNPMVWNFVSGEMQRARAESKRKATFSKNNISLKLESAKAGNLVYFGGLSPSWILGIKNKAGERIVKGTADKTGVQWIMENGKVKAVQRMFSLYREGEACTAIACLLNEENVKTVKTGGIWTNTTIKRFLKSKSVMGHCTVNDFQSESYYPEIVSKNDFYKVQARLDKNSGNRGGSPHGQIPNLFKGLTKCTCGSGITVFSSIAKEKRYSYCKCTEAKLKGKCKNGTRWVMREFEKEIFRALLEKLPHELLDQPKTKDDTILDDLKGELNKLNSEVTDMVKMIGKVKFAQLESALLALQKKQGELQDQIAAQENAMAVAEASPYALEKLTGLLESNNINDLVKGYVELERNLADVEVRKQLCNLMPDIFKSIVMDFNKANYTATFTNGKSIKYHFEAAEKKLTSEAKSLYRAFKQSQKKLAAVTA